jgi:hypothetical protein
MKKVMLGLLSACTILLIVIVLVSAVAGSGGDTTATANQNANSNITVASAVATTTLKVTWPCNPGAPNPVGSICGKLKATVLEQTVERIQTMDAEFAKTPVPPTAKVSKPLLKMLTAPASAKDIEPVTPDRSHSDATDNPLIDVTSEWSLGAVPNTDYTDWFGIGIVSGPYGPNHQNALRTILVGGPQLERTKYNKVWIPPHNIGAITITNITKGSDGLGIHGLVYFKGANGETGTFDLKTEQWHFDNSSVAIAAVTPAPTIFTTIPEPTLTPTFTPNAR